MDIRGFNVNHLSYSSLKQFRKSPLHFIEYKKKPFKKTDMSDEMIKGTVCELLLFGESVEKEFIIYEKFPRRKQADKERWAEMVKEANKKDMGLLTTEMLETCKEIVEIAKMNPNVMELVRGITKTQVKLFWKDKNTGLYMLGFVDAETIYKENIAVIEVKTANEAEPIKFLRNAKYLDYPLQTGFYLEGYKRTKFKFPDFYYIVIETSAPYGAYVIRAEDKWINYGKHELTGTLKAFNYCVNNDLWDSSRDFRLLDTRQYFQTDLNKYYDRIYSHLDENYEPKTF